MYTQKVLVGVGVAEKVVSKLIVSLPIVRDRDEDVEKSSSSEHDETRKHEPITIITAKAGLKTVRQALLK